MARGAKGDQRPIIIKKVKKIAGGHHGGAWKVAYADFVTAMMAFFMLLWLLTVTDKQTLKGIADYFTPSKATMSNSSGSGNILGGTSLQKDGANSSGSVSIAQQDTPTSQDSAKAAKDKAQEAAMMMMQQDIQNAIQNAPTLAEFKNQLILDVTPEGLRIQLVDRDGRPMFKAGTAEPFPYAVALIRLIGGIVSNVPNRVSVQGHADTSSSGMVGVSNWVLSSDRANAARAIMEEARVSDHRFAEVVGKGASDPLYPDTPARAENRRVAFIILNEAPVVAPDFGH
jgi:chemotaxis protein MotB